MNSHNRIAIALFCIFCLLVSACETFQELDYIAFKADFNAPLVVRQGEEIQFNPSISTSKSKSFLWNFGDKNNNTSNANAPVFQYDSIGAYKVKLKVEIDKSIGLVRDSIEKTIRVLPNTVDAPSGLLNQKEFGGADADEIAFAMDSTIGNGLVLVGRKDINTLYVARLDAAQTIVWNAEIDDIASGAGLLFPRDVLLTLDGSVVIVGYIQYQFNTSDNDAFVIKLGSDGIEEWREILNSSNDESYTAIHETIDGNYFLTGTFATLNKPAVAVHEFSPDGEVNYFQKIPQELCNSCRATQAKPTNDGGFVITGTEINRPMLIKLSENYVFEGKSTVSSLGKANQVAQLTDGKFVVVGEVRTSASDSTHAFVAKFDFVGGVESWKQILILYNESFCDIAETKDGSGDILVIGNHQNPLSNRDILVAKYESNLGNLLKVKLAGNDLNNEAAQVLINSVGIVSILGTNDGQGTKEISLINLNSNFFE